MPPSGDLLQTFKDLIEDFKNARSVGDYSNFLQYLHRLRC
jgi:hypothetical protein